MIHRQDKNLYKLQPIRQSIAPKGKLIRKQGKIPDEAENGVVTASIGRFFLVSPEKNYINTLIKCVASGKIISPYNNSTMIAVGDKVSFILDKNSGKLNGKIIKVEQRASWLSRKAAGKSPIEHVIASNVSHILIFVSTTQPQYNKRLIDRYIIAAELGMIKPVIVVNKIDLMFNEYLVNDFSIYQKLDIPVFFISSINHIGIEKIVEFLTNRFTVLSGPSGSGKSTFINLIIGKDTQQVLEISYKTSKGQHATTNVRMLKLPDGGSIIDTPGIREFAIWGIDKQELALYFHDFDPYNPRCKYYPCTHLHEPDCAVIEAVKSGLIDEGRYISYLNIYDSLK
jgi:ribosome biogenesis GTPase